MINNGTSRPVSGRTAPTRRALLAGFLALPALSGLAGRPALAAAPRLDLTPSCGAEPELTPRQTEGPFFSAGSPRRHDLRRAGATGDPIALAGLVVDRDCRPVADARIELWHADPSGLYDNDGYAYRGHHRTDSAGRWWFSTVVPGAYPGRTPHFHVKVAPPGAGTLTTQLYLPGEPLNRRDAIFDPDLVLALTRTADGHFGRFDFVV